MAAGTYVLLGVVLAVALGVVWTDLCTHVLFAPALLQGKRVVVCGASMGIGEQIAYQYAQYNTSVSGGGGSITCIVVAQVVHVVLVL